MSSEEANVVTEVTETVSSTTVEEEPDYFPGYEAPGSIPFYAPRTLLDESPPRQGVHSVYSSVPVPPTVQKMSRLRTTRRRPQSAQQQYRSLPAPNIMDTSPPRQLPPSALPCPPRPPSPQLMGERSTPVRFRSPPKSFLDSSPPRRGFPSPMRPKSPQLMHFPESPTKPFPSRYDVSEFEDLYCPTDYQEEDFFQVTENQYPDDGVEVFDAPSEMCAEDAPYSRSPSPRQAFSRQPSPFRSPHSQPTPFSPVSPRSLTPKCPPSRTTPSSRSSRPESTLSLLSNISSFGSPLSPRTFDRCGHFQQLVRQVSPKDCPNTSSSPRGVKSERRPRKPSPCAERVPSPSKARVPRSPVTKNRVCQEAVRTPGRESDALDHYGMAPFETDDEYFAHLDALGVKDPLQNMSFSPRAIRHALQTPSPASQMSANAYSRSSSSPFDQSEVSEFICFDTPGSYSDMDDMFDKTRFTPGSDGLGRYEPREMTPGAYRKLGRAEKQAERRAIQRLYDQDRRKMESELHDLGREVVQWRGSPGSPQPGCSNWPPTPPQRWTPKTPGPRDRHSF